MFKKIFTAVLFINCFVSQVNADDYIWPTDASRYLTSSFAEYRPGHFHAGIDIKTWGREGYKIFAIRDGYVSRIRVSPFGYGKALYLTLDTGEIVVYAHLKGFNEKLEAIVKREQKRKGEYRINIYLSKSDVPVKQGDILGFTGSTGIGYPHLHFETRDSKNQPTNPMLLGYKIKDTVPPGIKAISITPLDAESRVNGDVSPLIIQPTHIESGEYEIAESLLLYGNVGLAIDCFDKANDVYNTYAVYKAELYIDGKREFGAKFDKFSYGVSGLIVLDRDYRLASQKKGLFQKLYIEENNRLPFYNPSGTGTGMLDCRMDAENRSGKGHLYLPGFHSFRIEISDYWGNVSFVQGEFWIGKEKRIKSHYHVDEQGHIVITGFSDENGRTITNPHIFSSRDSGNSWQKKPWYFQGDPYIFERTNPHLSEVLKVIAINEYGIKSYPEFIFHNIIEMNSLESDSITASLEKKYFDDFIRFELNLSRPLPQSPTLMVKQKGVDAEIVDLIQSSLDSYWGVYKLKPNYDGLMKIDVFMETDTGRVNLQAENVNLSTISPNNGGTMRAWDGNCEVIFKSNSVYRTLYGRIEAKPEILTEGYDRVGIVYSVSPMDVPLKRGATVHLKYPDSDTLVSKLGVYGNSGGDRWGFMGARENSEKGTISARMGGLRNVTLIRDVEPPIVTIYSPRNGVQTDPYPLLQAFVDDELSGIASERSITMELDNEKVIAEYDPEKDLISYKCEERLSSGKHEVKVTVIDNVNNSTIRSHVFYIK